MTNAEKFKHLFGIYATELWAMSEDDFLEWLNADAQDMPTAERKTGKWIPQDNNKTNGMASTLVYYYPKCSVCGHCDNYTNFCPNCGADMRGEDDDIPMEYFESGGI